MTSPPTTTLRLTQGELEHEADLMLTGLQWRLVRATDAVIILVHADQYAIIDVRPGSMALRVYPDTVVDVSGSDVRFIEN